MKRGFVTAIAANGSVLVHDAEIAMVGSTSEMLTQRSAKAHLVALTKLENY